jgi:hypothetical protein
MGKAVSLYINSDAKSLILLLLLRYVDGTLAVPTRQAADLLPGRIVSNRPSHIMQLTTLVLPLSKKNLLYFHYLKKPVLYFLVWLWN